MTPQEFREWQIQHYTERLAEETRTDARAWLRAELYRLKQKTD